jgi:choline dehydrogenase-like flavoprotein
VGFACHVDAKNGTQNTMVPRAIASGNCTLLTDAHVLRIDMDNAQTAKGVTYVDATGTQHHATAGIVIVAAGAIETARLFLNSATSAHPNGIGNHSDQLGRHLQGHVYPRAIGLLPDAVIDHQGPGVSICTTQFNHGNPDIIGGGMLADEFITLPIIFWKRFLPPDVPRWGKAAKDFMRYAYPRFIDVTGPIQDIPSPDSRVTVDPRVRDRFGLPVARLSGTTHPESIRTAAFMFERAREWIEAAGVTRWWGTPPTLGLSASQHQAGTCRMGDDPATSVTDRWGKIHGIRNIYVADGSLHVTNGGFNPFLTIMANAFRVVDGIVQRGN